jgi:hypothetical protein
MPNDHVHPAFQGLLNRLAPSTTSTPEATTSPPEPEWFHLCHGNKPTGRVVTMLCGQMEVCIGPFNGLNPSDPRRLCPDCLRIARSLGYQV